MRTSADSCYVDSSALVKLVLEEPESAALEAALRAASALFTSALARVEVVRAVLHEGRPGVDRARQRLSECDILALDLEVLDRAADLHPTALRSLDAVHLASALSLGPSVKRFVTYDRRLASAARRAGFEVEAPA